MRRINQNTITDRIFGDCQDCQAVTVVVSTRRLTVLLCLWGKRTLRHYCRKIHAISAWNSARPMATEQISCPAQHAAAQCVPSPGICRRHRLQKLLSSFLRPVGQVGRPECDSTREHQW